MIRYDIDIDTMSDGYHASEPVLERIISPDGEWVRATHALAIEEERDQLRARVAELEAARRRICVIFDGHAGRFVEVENEHGASIRVGEWRERDDGLWSLDIDRCVGTEDSR